MREAIEKTRGTGIEAQRVPGVVSRFVSGLGTRIGMAALAVVAACSPDTQAGNDGSDNSQPTELRTVEKALEMNEVTREGHQIIGRIPGGGQYMEQVVINADGTYTISSGDYFYTYPSESTRDSESTREGAPIDGGLRSRIEYAGESLYVDASTSEVVDGVEIQLFYTFGKFLIDLGDGLGLRAFNSPYAGRDPSIIGDKIYFIRSTSSGDAISSVDINEIRENAVPGGEMYMASESSNLIEGFDPVLPTGATGHRIYPFGSFIDGKPSFVVAYSFISGGGLRLQGDTDLMVLNPDGSYDVVILDNMLYVSANGDPGFNDGYALGDIGPVFQYNEEGQLATVPGAIGVSSTSTQFAIFRYQYVPTSTGGDDVGVDTSDAGADVEDTTDTTDTSDTADAGADAVDTTDTSDTADTEADTTDTTDTSDAGADTEDTTDTTDASDTTDTGTDAEDTTDTTDTEADATDTTDTADTEADATDTTDTADTEADATDTTDTPDTEADATDTTDTIDTSIEHAPPAPVDLQVEEIGSNYATIGWQMPDVEYNYHVSGFVVMIAEEPDSPFKSANPAPLIDMNAMTATIPGLSPDTQYRVQVKPFCLVNGSMIEGDAVETTFETLEVEVEPDVTEDTSDTGADAGDTTDTTDAGADTDADTDAGNEGDSAASDVLGDSNLDTGQVVEHKEGREAGGCSAVQAETNQAVNLVLGVLALGAAGRRRRR